MIREPLHHRNDRDHISNTAKRHTTRGCGRYPNQAWLHTWNDMSTPLKKCSVSYTWDWLAWVEASLEDKDQQDNNEDQSS